MKRNLLIAAIATAIIAAPATATVLLKTGALEQLPGKKGCLAGSNSGCARARAVTRVTNLIVSADGKNVYVSGGVGANSQIAAFKRKTTNGLLSQLKGKNGCVLFAGYGGGKVCALGRSIDTPSTPALSPNGKNLYVAATHSLAVDVFKRTPSTGALTQLAGTAGCLSLQGTGGACTVAPGLDQAAAVAVSPDGAQVYVAGSGIAAFARDATTGALTQLAGTGGCINSDGSAPCAIANGLSQLRAIAISSDGKNVYVGGGGGKHGSLAAFERDLATGALTQLAGAQGCYSQAGEDANCTPAVALQQVSSMVLSPGGEQLYVTSAVSSGVAVFARDPVTGALAQLAGKNGCVTTSGSGGKCAKGRALVSAGSIAISKDGKTVYVAAANWKRGGVAVFARNAVSGVLHQLPGKQGCYGSKKIGCTPMRGVTKRPISGGFNVWGPGGVAVSSNGKNVYVVGGAIAVFSRKR